MSLGATGGGVAYWAHIGGFVAGILLIKLLPARPGARPSKYASWRPGSGPRRRRR